MGGFYNHHRDHGSRRYTLLLVATFWVCGTCGVAGGAEPAGQSPKAEPTRGQGAAGILIDAIHANEFSTIGLKPGVYA